MAKIESPIELSYVCFDEPKRYPSSTARNGIRRDRENDEETTTVVSITDTIVVPPGEEVSFTLTHIPNGEVIISPEVEYIHEEDTYDYVFSNEEEESITITLSYSYDEVIFVPAWEQITQWEYGEGTQPIYKGEGKISFICYFPFAKSVYKVLPEGSEDWAISSGILSAEDYDIYQTDVYNSNEPTLRLKETQDVEVESIDEAVFLSECSVQGEYIFICESQLWYLNETSIGTNDDLEAEYGIKVNLQEFNANFTIEVTTFTGFKIYNAGDISTGFRVYCPFNISYGMHLTYYLFENMVAALNIETITPKLNQTGALDEGFLINTDNGLIQGIQEFILDDDGNPVYTTSGNIYNQYVESGYFFKLEPNNSFNEATLEITDENDEVILGDGIRIFYDYLYF